MNDTKQQLAKALEQGDASEIVRLTQALQNEKALDRATRIGEIRQDLAALEAEHEQALGEARQQRTLSLAAADAVEQARKAAGLAARQAGIAENRLQATREQKRALEAELETLLQQIKNEVEAAPKSYIRDLSRRV